jgi:NADP-dependent 3-hydroxy acid dehydrogenase YdfG
MPAPQQTIVAVTGASSGIGVRQSRRHLDGLVS